MQFPIKKYNTICNFRCQSYKLNKTFQRLTSNRNGDSLVYQRIHVMIDFTTMRPRIEFFLANLKALGSQIYQKQTPRGRCFTANFIKLFKKPVRNHFIKSTHDI